MSIENWPIVAPLKALLESRKFLLAVSVIATYLLTHAVPTLLPYADGISTITLIALGMVFAHLSVEDMLILRAGLKIDVNQAVVDARSEIANAAGAIITGGPGAGTVTTTTTTSADPVSAVGSVG